MTRHTSRGTIFSIRADDGYGNLALISFDALISKLVTFERTSNVEIY